MANSVKTRDSALNAIKRYMTKSKNNAFTMDEDTVNSYLQLLNEQWVRFNTAQDAVETSCGDAVKEAEEDTRIQGETWYAEALANFNRVQKCRTESQPPSTPTPVAAAIRLPKMELPTFSGDPTDWISFFDAFSSLIDKNTTLSKGQKLHYLRGCLKGDALKIITGFKVCDANYVEAWDLLQSRYKVMRVIVEGHLRAMANIKVATHDSADAIKGVVDAFQQHIRELKALGRTVDFWDDWLVHEVVNRLAFETRKQWELSLESDECPTFEQLTTFLEVRCRSLALLSSSTKSVPVKAKLASVAKSTNVFHAVQEQSSANCGYCNGAHRLYSCEKFKNSDFNTKSKFVRESRLCTNCLSSGHYKAKCNSTSACRVCHQRHHTLLHNAPAAPNTSTSTHSVNNTFAGNPISLLADPLPQATSSTSSYCRPSHPCTPTAGVSSYLNTDLIPSHSTQRAVLLATALVKIQDYSGRWQPARLLFDSGSHASFITEACVQRLKLPRRASAIIVTGIGSSQGGRSRGEVRLSISSYYTDQLFNINALILPKITSELPTQSVPISDWPHIQGLFLADPDYMKPGRIDMLVGMDVMQNFVCAELRKGPSGTPMAQRTVFGWTLFGNIDHVKTDEIYLQSLHCDIQLDRALTRIWELEESPVKKHLTSEERHCEELFETTHQRSSDGRFTVELPLKPGVQLGESRSYAVRSLLRIEKRLGQDNHLQKRYNEFMEELLAMEHMELAPDTPNPTYYMPHHPVVKESSLTTKLRVVFNASAKTSNGNSLNDALFIGPQLQQDLFSILTRFRMHRFAMTADVAKMYRQVCVSPKHTDLQRIVWRRNTSLPIQDYRMLRVTYGVSAASHLAVKSLQQTAKSSPNANEEAAAIILKDFYMDDLLTGASSKEGLISLQKTVSRILQEGGFELRKWASNCAELTENISNSSKAMSHYLVEGEEVHALGLMWNTEDDNLSFTVNLRSTPAVFTKRILLSDASTLFDPLGLLAPTTIKAKMWLQEIWRSKVGWDDAVPSDIVARWLEHRSELKLLSNVKVNRWLGSGVPESFTELHVFADASERAYAAVIYARTLHVDGKVSVAIISSKTKVAPVKTTTLPRLELCAAHLSAKLARSVLQSLHGNHFSLYAWTDSTITLAWIQAHPSRWVTFIANRVADIQEVLPPERWNHVRSELNPADCASRGVTPRELLQQRLWWAGPEFLRGNDEFWKTTSPQHTTEMGIRKKVAVHITTPNEHWSLFTKFSSYSKLRRVVAYVLRFCGNARISAQINATKRIGTPNCSEISEAEMRLIRYTQIFYFPNEISLCRANKPISLSSSILRLQPYMDEKGILRVGGRLKNAELTPDAKYPIILPKDSPLSKLIIHDIHLYTLHGGPRIIQTVLQRRYWIIGARNLIRNVYHKCVKCTCFNRNITTQTMGNLPQLRTNFARCFTHAAVDFAGPYMYKYTHGRGAKSTKGYICSFVCMCTGAMHLEFVSDLSTPAFLNAFKRFLNRRGHCKIMSSDNGTNFVGAEKYLRIAYQQCHADSRFRQFFADSNIEWRFNPPSAPHMGGYWETGIKRIKYHLKRILGETLLSYEEFHTLLTEIEACVNSRPLCDNPATAGDLEVLTPGHFIIGEPLKSIPEPEGQGFWGNLGQRWHAISALRQHFWRRWRDEYLVNLQRRAKWFRPSRNIKEGDVVAIYKEPTPPTKWMLGRVIKCHPGSDGRVRVVTLKTPHGELVRPVIKLCLLPTSEDLFSEADKIF